MEEKVCDKKEEPKEKEDTSSLKINHRTSLAAVLGSLQSGEIANGFQPTFPSETSGKIQKGGTGSSSLSQNEQGQSSQYNGKTSRPSYQNERRGGSNERSWRGGRGRGRGGHFEGRGRGGGNGFEDEGPYTGFSNRGRPMVRGDSQNYRGRGGDRYHRGGRGGRFPDDRTGNPNMMPIGQPHHSRAENHFGEPEQYEYPYPAEHGFPQAVPEDPYYPPHDGYLPPHENSYDNFRGRGHRGRGGMRGPRSRGGHGAQRGHPNQENYQRPPYFENPAPRYPNPHEAPPSRRGAMGEPGLRPPGPRGPPPMGHQSRPPPPPHATHAPHNRPEQPDTSWTEQYNPAEWNYSEYPYENYYSENYIVEYYEVDEMGNHYPMTDQSYYGNYYPEYYTYDDGTGQYVYDAKAGNAQTYATGPETEWQPGMQNGPSINNEIPDAKGNPAAPPLPRSNPVKPPLPKTATSSQQSSASSADPSNFEDAGANVHMTEEQLKSLAQTVASLENQTQGDLSQKEPIEKVIAKLMNQGKSEDRKGDRLKQQAVTALGISLEMDPNPEGILDRLETKFSASSTIKSETTDSNEKTGSLEANLAKAYSHFLQASESRKRDSSTLESDSHSEIGSPKKPVRKTFDVGLGISLDINYDASLALSKDEDTPHNSSFDDSQKLSPRHSYSPPPRELHERTSRPFYDPYGKSRSPVSSQDSRNNYSPGSQNRRRLSPQGMISHDSRGRSPSPPQMDNDDDFDRRSSSPEAPPVLIDDEDNVSKPAARPPLSRNSPSPPRDNTFDDDNDDPFGRPEGTKPSGPSGRPPGLGFNSRGDFGGNSWSQRKPPVYCRVKVGKERCNERFFDVFPNYLDHCKLVHNLKTGIPCLENKCQYIAPGVDQFMNHMKARHTETPAETS